MDKVKQRKKRVANGQPLQQVAALAYRCGADGRLEILVLSSRETHRAIIPKGWPIKGRKDWKAAQIEALQEAGVVGDIARKRLGQYKYWKRLENHFALVKVTVYALAVRRQLDDWPERHEREQAWLPAADAALLLDEPELSALISTFAASDAWKRTPPKASRPRSKEPAPA